MNGDILFVVALLVVVLWYLSLTAWIFGRSNIVSLRIISQHVNWFTAISKHRSPTLEQIFKLTSAAEDRSSVIKQYYAWRQKVLLSTLTGVGAYISATSAAFISATFKGAQIFQNIATSIGSSAKEVEWTLGLSLGLLLAWCIRLFFRLAELQSEYLDAINLYQSFR